MSVSAPNKIIWHWTAGGYKASDIDKEHYHFIIDGDAIIVSGDHAPEDNNDCTDDDYAAHVKMANTGAIGVAVCGMVGAVEKPFSTGICPLKQNQIDALVSFTSDLSHRYDIPITMRTILSHAEVEKTLGIDQNGKWDIMWLPGMHRPEDAVKVGDDLRRLVAGAAIPPALPVGITKLTAKLDDIEKRLKAIEKELARD